MSLTTTATPGGGQQFFSFPPKTTDRQTRAGGRTDGRADEAGGRSDERALHFGWREQSDRQIDTAFPLLRAIRLYLPLDRRSPLKGKLLYGSPSVRSFDRFPSDTPPTHRSTDRRADTPIKWKGKYYCSASSSFNYWTGLPTLGKQSNLTVSRSLDGGSREGSEIGGHRLRNHTTC